MTVNLRLTLVSSQVGDRVRMTVEEAFSDLLRITREAGKWKPGDRFWIQVRAYTVDTMVLRFFNIETAETYDHPYPRSPSAP